MPEPPTPAMMPRRLRPPEAHVFADVLIEDNFRGYAWSTLVKDQVVEGESATPEEALLEAAERFVPALGPGSRVRVCLSPGMSSRWAESVELDELDGVIITVETARTSWMPEPWRNRLQMYVSPSVGGLVGWLLFDPRTGSRIASGSDSDLDDALGSVQANAAQACARRRDHGRERPLLHVTASPKVATRTGEVVMSMTSPNGDHYATMSAQAPPAWVAGQIAAMGGGAPSAQPCPDGPLVVATDGSAGLRSSGWSSVDDMGNYRVRSQGRIQINTVETTAVRETARAYGHPAVILSDSLLAVRSAPVPAHVRSRWVKGHDGHTMNEAADRLALHARRSRDAGMSPDDSIMNGIVAEMLDELDLSGLRHPDAHPSRRTE